MRSRQWLDLSPFNLSYAPFTVMVLFCVGVAVHTHPPDEPVTVEIEPPPELEVERPDFAAIADVTLRKQTFFDYMLPMVRAANRETLADRASIQHLREKLVSTGRLSVADWAILHGLFDKYRLVLEHEPTVADIDRLLVNCDVVPASLVLAQSANESGWGTSRFAIDGNNFFGLWCFTEGCGLTPLQREDGASHEVASFESVSAGVAHYMRTINTNHAYRELRAIRATLRAENRTITGAALAEGLLRYSERGEAYVEEIRQMIHFNQLYRFNLATHTTAASDGDGNGDGDGDGDKA